VQLYECTKVIQYQKQYQYSVSVQATMGPHRTSYNPCTQCSQLAQHFTLLIIHYERVRQ